MGAVKSNETSERPMNDPCLLRSFLLHTVTQYTLCTIIIMITTLSIRRTIIRTVVRIVGMGRMSHICNTKCSRL